MDSQTCSCWRCWFQGTFTSLVLFAIVLLSFFATVILMHEQNIEDKYVTWLEGFCGGALTSLAVALKTQSPGSNSHAEQVLPPGTTQVRKTLETTVKEAPPEDPKIQEPTV